MIRYGLCCISKQLQLKNINAQTMRWCSFSKLPKAEALERLHDRTLNNLNVILQHLHLCHAHNWTYRIGSDIVPLATHAGLRNKKQFYWPQSTEIGIALDKIKKFITESNIRCSMHPDQFVVPASNNPTVVDNSINQLEFQAHAMDMFGLPQTYEAPINIHMNSHKGNISDIFKRFVKAFKRMSPGVRNRLVLENEDKLNSWTVKELYDWTHTNLGVPITYDSLHHRLNPGAETDPEVACELAYKTWPNKFPVFHYSRSRPESKNPRAHADYAEAGCIHDELNKFHHDPRKLDVDFELKAKDFAILDYEQTKKIKL